MTDQQNRQPVGARIRFDGKRTVWRVRAETADGRFSLATTSVFGNVLYTIIEWDAGIRGAMNVVGQGLSIFTTDGPDEAVDDAIEMLDADDGWGISRRNFVDLNVSDVLTERVGGRA